mgnify:CR=1 FL=1
MAQITKEQYQELKNAELWDYEEFLRLLKKYTGIEARPCSSYQFFDDAGDYVGTSGDDVAALLEAAYVEVK